MLKKSSDILRQKQVFQQHQLKCKMIVFIFKLKLDLLDSYAVNIFLSYKVHIFWEGHKILRNLHRRLVLCSASQFYGGDFAKKCRLPRIYELYKTFLPTLTQRIMSKANSHWFFTVMNIKKGATSNFAC